jgi:hypothetical protein
MLMPLRHHAEEEKPYLSRVKRYFKVCFEPNSFLQSCPHVIFLLFWGIESHVVGIDKFLIRLAKPGHYQGYTLLRRFRQVCSSKQRIHSRSSHPGKAGSSDYGKMSLLSYITLWPIIPESTFIIVSCTLQDTCYSEVEFIPNTVISQ